MINPIDLVDINNIPEEVIEEFSDGKDPTEKDTAFVQLDQEGVG